MEMNLHAPQSVEAATELREIAAVPLQIVSPRESVPIVSVVQDTLVGANRFTRSDVLFNRREAMNLLVHAKRWNGVLPAPVVTEPQPMWNGRQLLSALLPPVNLQMVNSSWGDQDKKETSENYVVISEGNIQRGILDKAVFSKQLLQIIYNDYGPDVTVDFLDSLQAMIANFLMNSGFSVGISDLIADESTNSEIEKELNVLTKKVEEQILQLHMGLFENNSGRSNQEEFEGKLMGTLNQAYSVAGKIGLKSLVGTNRMTNMVKAGSKGSDVNVSQMIATLGQQAIEGKRVPNGFQHRTLPHFKRFDDSARARGFIKSSYIKGLQPDEFFFHAMSGREGLIDTAVKSVTGDTEVVVMEDGVMKHTTIGEWIDRHIAMNSDVVEHIEENNMEYLNLHTDAYIPTVDVDGRVTWGSVKAVTRHDPGKMLYQIKTRAGKTVTVTESQSLLVWDEASKQFLPKRTPDVSVGEFVPVTASLPAPPTIVSAVRVASYLPKTEYLYGSDYVKAVSAMKEAMEGREHIPSGWWAQNNGSAFTLPYDSKARLQRATVRSNVSNIKEGYVYPFTTNRDHALIPESFVMNAENGLFMGLFLAEGNVDIKSGYVQITNNDATIRNFVKGWFENMGIRTSEEVKTNHIGATSSCVRGYSVLLAKLFTALMGHGAGEKHVPSEAFAAPEEFVVALLNGYFSGDGTLTENSIEASSASERLIDGISMLCTRIGVFGKVFTTKISSNNLGTQNIQPAYRLAIRAQWASRFAEKVNFIHAEKEAKRKALVATESHRNFAQQNDVVLDTITEINPVDPAAHPKMYDLTVPSTFNFGLANGLQVRDTADTGYMQRQIRVALEDLISQHDGSVCDATGNILQIAYGEDGMNATKLEMQPYDLGTWDDARIAEEFAADGAPDAQQYIEQIKADRKMLVEYLFRGKPQKSVKYPVYLDRIIYSLRGPFNMQPDAGTVTATEVLAMQKMILNRTHAHNRLWAGLVRYNLRPKRLQQLGYTPEALQALGEQIVLKHMQAWVEPGQPVGVIAAQSIGEPATQMTLNTFHLAGVAAKSNMTRGVPRLKELLKATHNPKAIELTIPLRPDLRDKKDEARRVAQDLEFTLLQDIVTVSRIYYDPNDGATLIQDDVDWLTYMTAFSNLSAPLGAAAAADPLSGDAADAAGVAAPSQSPWILRLELDREKMFTKNITMDDVAFILKSRLGAATMHYTDYNSNRLVFRIRLDDESDAQIDQLNTLKILQNKILSATAVRGIPGLRAVNYQKVSDMYEFNAEAGKYMAVDQYTLISDGSNFLDVLAHPDVDATRLYSSNIHDMLDNLGIEACHAALFKEITTLFAESGSSVNYRHVSILIDRMCHKGRTMSVDRYGIQKNDIGPLAKMRFEQTEDIALRAAMFGEQDPCLGISAKVMLGAPIKAGTCFSEILFDEEVAVNLAASAPVNQRLEHPKPLVAYTDEELDARLYGGGDEGTEGACNLNELRMNVALPNVPLGTVEEGDEDDVEITRV